LTNILERGPVAASEEEQTALSRIETVMEDAVNSEEAQILRIVGSDGEAVEIPASVFQILRQSIYYLAHDQAVTILPISKDLTTQEAADILNVSRPYLIKLLEEGAIPFTKTGSHRRVPLADLLAYKQQWKTRRRKALAELTQLSQDMGLYDE
jgi:excisionase family DNA binding protein